jgi:RimJ/RimL family protein N-acetyltransferase
MTGLPKVTPLMSIAPLLPLRARKTTLRRITVKDLAEWYALEADPDVKRYIGGPVRKPAAEWIEEARKRLPISSPIAVVETESGHFVGRASLDWDRERKVSEVAVVIAKAFWGDRYRFGRDVSELLIDFSNLGVEKVVAVVHPQNEASRKLLDRLGFACVGERSGNPDDWQNGHLVFELAVSKKGAA